MPWLWNLLGLLSIPALVVVNGLFVAAEFALVSVRKTRIEEIASRGVKGARAAEIAIDRLDRTIAAFEVAGIVSHHRFPLRLSDFVLAHLE